MAKNIDMSAYSNVQNYQLYEQIRKQLEEERKSKQEIYDEVARRRKIAHSGGYQYIGSGNLEVLDRQAGGLKPAMPIPTTKPKIISTNLYNRYYDIYANGASRSNKIVRGNQEIKPDYAANPMQSTNLASSLGWDAGMGMENSNPLFNLYVRNYDLDLKEAIVPTVKLEDYKPSESSSFRPKDYDANVNFMEGESLIEGREETAESVEIEENRRREWERKREKKEIYEKYRYLYEWRVAEGIEAAKEWEKLHGNHMVSMDKAVAYANGYMTPQEEAQFTEEQLYAMEQWGKLSQVRDLMDDYIDAYGENGKFNRTNLKRIDAAMDRFVEYDPRIGTKLAYIVNAWARGAEEAVEDGVDYLKVATLGEQACNVVVGLTGDASGDKELLEDTRRKQEEILSNDKYDKMRERDGERFNLSQKELRIGGIAEAIGRGSPAAALLLIPGIGPALAAVYVGVTTAGQASKQIWKEGGMGYEQIAEEGQYDEAGKKKGVSVQEAVSYGGLIGLIDAVTTYFGARLFNPGTLDGLGNRIVGRMASTAGGQALLNTVGGTLSDTGLDMVTLLLKEGIKKSYNPETERISEEELQKLVYTSLVANLVINGMQNLVAYTRGLTAETGPSEADERAMMRQLSGEGEAEAPRGRAEEPEAEMMGQFERQTGERLEGGGAEQPAGRSARMAKEAPEGARPSGVTAEQAEMMDTFAENTGAKQGETPAAKTNTEVNLGEKASTGARGPQIEGSRDREAAVLTEAVAAETGAPIPKAMEGPVIEPAKPVVTTSADAASDDILNPRGVGGAKKTRKATSQQKPYTNSRPSYARGQVEQVWENAKDPITGKVYDPTGKEIPWDTTRPRKGQWDMGHIPGQKYSDVHEQYMDGIITKEEFLEWYKNPDNYRPELPSTNRSHFYE